MNQRVTYFSLGNNSQNYDSVYKKGYNAKKVEGNNSNGSNSFRIHSLNMCEKGLFSTTNKCCIRHGITSRRPNWMIKKLHKLKNHHFKLGAYNPNHILTNNKIYYDKNQIQDRQVNTKRKAKTK